MGILRNIKTIVLLLAVLTLVAACKESGKINLAEKENTAYIILLDMQKKTEATPQTKTLL